MYVHAAHTVNIIIVNNRKCSIIKQKLNIIIILLYSINFRDDFSF